MLLPTPFGAEEPAPRNSPLNPEQVAFIKRLTEEAKRRKCYNWVLDGAVLYCSREGKDRGLRDVPTQFSFYESLAQLGYLAIERRQGAFGLQSRTVLEITVTALALSHEERVAMLPRDEERRPLSVFYAYAREDESLQSELESHLSLMSRQGLIANWHDRKIGPGREWEGEIDAHLNTAQIILPLISPDFLASDYCYDVEMKRAMERHEAGEARVIPVILRPCDWKNAPFARLQVLPRDGKAVTVWSNKDEAFLSIVEGIRMVLDEFDRGGITPDLIRKGKQKWREEVEKRNCEAASRNGKIQTIDYVNIPRIVELALSLLGTVPETRHTFQLASLGLIDAKGLVDMERINANYPDRSYPFDFFESFLFAHHYFEVFKACLGKLNLQNLDDLLRVRTLKDPVFIGTWCFYAGGLYSKGPRLPIRESTPITHLYLKKRGFYVEWKFDPRYMTSSTAIGRLFEHTCYLVYGSVRGVSRSTIRGKKYWCVDIRPYVFGAPEVTIDRTPLVYYQRKALEDAEDRLIELEQDRDLAPWSLEYEEEDTACRGCERSIDFPLGKEPNDA